MRACASLELLHASALVHDDYMDASDTRRGRPATHRGFAAEHRADGWRGDPEQYGASAAILLGDLLLSWSDELLRRCGLPTERVVSALDVFDRCRSEVITGQFLDVSVQARGVADVDAAMTVLRYKSAKYSIERPLHIGATLAGGTPDQLRQLSAFGLPLGEAFQLRDDLLGVFGDPSATGKPAGGDLVEGKRTVLVALALDAAPRPDAARLDAALGTPLTDADVAELRRIIDDSGAHEQVEQVIGELATTATGALARGRHRRAEPATYSSSWRPPPPTGWSDRAENVGGFRARVESASVQGGDAVDVGAVAAEQDREAAALVGVDPAAEHGERDGEGTVVLPGERAPAVPEQDPALAVAGGDVAEAVGERVEVLAVVVGEVQRRPDRLEELRLGGVVPAVDLGEAASRRARPCGARPRPGSAPCQR